MDYSSLLFGFWVSILLHFFISFVPREFYTRNTILCQNAASSLLLREGGKKEGEFEKESTMNRFLITHIANCIENCKDTNYC